MNAQETARNNLLENANDPHSYTGRMLTFLSAKVVRYQRAARFWFGVAAIGIVTVFCDICFTNGAYPWVVFLGTLAGVVGVIAFFECRRSVRFWNSQSDNAQMWVEMGRMDVKAGTLKVVKG